MQILLLDPNFQLVGPADLPDGIGDTPYVEQASMVYMLVACDALPPILYVQIPVFNLDAPPSPAPPGP